MEEKRVGTEEKGRNERIKSRNRKNCSNRRKKGRNGKKSRNRRKKGRNGREKMV